MAILAQVIAIHVGRPRSFEAEDDSRKPWTSGIIKSFVRGPVYIGRLNIVGDEQADLVHHGGFDKAVLVYPQENYSFWDKEFPGVLWRSGCFGENLTLAGLTEHDVCIGDVFRLGQCVLQVSQPRQPCWKLSRRWGLSKLAVRVQETRLTGWYMRVLTEGEIATSQSMVLTERLYPDWTVQRANEIMFSKTRDQLLEEQLANCPALSKSWRETLGRRAKRSVEISEALERQRLEGT